MEWLKNGWETQWMHTRTWPETITPDELQKRLQSMEKIGKSSGGSGNHAHRHTTLFLQELTLSLFAATKWELEHKPCDKDVASYFTLIYGAELAKYLEAYLHNPAPAEEDELNALMLHSIAFQMDQTKLMLRSLADCTGSGFKSEPRRVSYAISTLRTLCGAIDKKTRFHALHANTDLPKWLPSHTVPRFTNSTYSRSPRDRSTPCSRRLLQPDHSEVSSTTEVAAHDDERHHVSTICSCNECKPELYLWIKVLLEHFGNGSSIPGYQLLVSLVYATVSQKLPLEVSEVVLRFVSIAIEFMKDNKRYMFLAPSLDILRHVYACFISQRMDKMSISTVSMITQHLSVIFSCLLPKEVADKIISDMQKRLRDQLLQFLVPTISGTKANHF